MFIAKVSLTLGSSVRGGMWQVSLLTELAVLSHPFAINMPLLTELIPTQIFVVPLS
jgi:hypothetical protein